MNGEIACAGLIERNGKFLMIKESKDAVSDQWSIPAGRVEKGESLQDCIQREVKEESGVTANPNSIVGVYFHTGGDQLKSIIVYDMEYVRGDPYPNHHDVKDARWVDEEDILDLNLRSHYILEAIEEYHTNERIPCSSVERVDLDPSTLSKIKMKLKSSRMSSKKNKKKFAQFMLILSFIAIAMRVFYEYINRLK